ncbi:MAG: hypothetical protein E6K76_03545 [Candidatus Eisenbacteria bacterium]|uniref:DUF494 domain-containing protein n=1 Tax=Eiseniibacteriota bacterium TaxID=2212470 RepID=A0A538T825_UNCEI|nr:MAG: hypothetical protein E6K76_03545 [Candidatus Eisenbacteria bacterium]
MDDNVREMMVLIVEQLKAYVDGNEDALLELTQVLDSGHHDADVVNLAFEMIFRALEPYSREDYPGQAKVPRKHVRVPTGPERALLSSPAYTYFFRLSESGRVTPEQFEEIMARARDEGPALDSEAKAEELATEVLIHWFDEEHGFLSDPGFPPTAH